MRTHLSRIIGMLSVSCLLMAVLASPAVATESPLFRLRTTNSENSKAVAARFAYGDKDIQGWDHVAMRMVEYGVDPDRIVDLFSDRRIPRREHLYFNPRPREPRTLYNGHNTRATRKNALAFYALHKQEFERAEELYQVPKEIILSILQIETRCGAYTGNHSIFYRLARLASAADPATIKENQKKVRRIAKVDIPPAEVAKRAQWLEDTFLPHVIATISLADRLGVDPLEIKGSNAGAIGLPQFLPGNLELHGSDANLDGWVDLFEPADAIHSVARFLQNHGWSSLSLASYEQKKVILHYNRSESYADTVLAMAYALRPQL